jgi:hypothetical protein
MNIKIVASRAGIMAAGISHVSLSPFLSNGLINQPRVGIVVLLEKNKDAVRQFID